MTPHANTEVRHSCAKSVEEGLRKLVEALHDNKEEIFNLLAEYQPIRVTQYEIDHYIHTLANVDKIQEHFEHYAGIKITTFLPSNLPTYSLLLFAIIPSFVAESVIVRPNSLLVGIASIEKLFKLLRLDEICPNIELFLGDRDEFITKQVANSDFVIFTGRNETKEIIKDCIRPGAYLINNGSGHNPIFVTETANVDDAVKGVTYSKYFNAGQDCAGPDACLVHEKHIKEFMEKIIASVSALKVGDHYDRDVLVGKILRLDELQKFQEIIDANKKNVVFGGKVDFENKIVYPTIILSDLTSPHINYNEMFGPILFIYSYTDRKQLKLYFEDFDGKYMQNKMYISIFSKDANYRVSEKDVGIVLHNRIILSKEIDNGFTAYGGYSRGASAIYLKKNGSLTSVSTPVFLPEVIKKLIIEKRPLKDAVMPKKSFTPGNEKVQAVKKDMSVYFITEIRKLLGSNLSFAFIKGETDKKNLNVFICVKELSSDISIALKKFKEDLHEKFGLKKVEESPDVVTHQEMSEMLRKIDCGSADFSFLWTNSAVDEYAKMVLRYTTALASDNKIALACSDKTVVKLLTAKAKTIITEVKNKMLNEIRKEDSKLPKYLLEKYPGCKKLEIIDELEHLDGDWDIIDYGE